MTHNLLGTAAALLAGALLSGCTGNGVQNSGNGTHDSAQVSAETAGIPSCYAASGLNIRRPDPTRAIFVLVDQTTGLNDQLRETLRQNVEHVLAQGTAVTVATFSDYSRASFPTNLMTGVVEPAVAEKERSSLPVRRLEALDACLAQQQAFARKQAEAALGRATRDASASFSHSQIMASLRKLSDEVRQAGAGDKIVIIVSDLLEHSDTTSFYENRALRLIDPDAELAKAAHSDLFGDFGGARIYVIGAGLLSPDAKDGTRNTRELGALRHFWEQWFANSHATVAGYGEPDLLTPVK